MAHTLVIDTSYGSTVGIVGYEPVVQTDSRTHVERLQANIGMAVSQAGLTSADIDAIIVGVGPAPFTGLRAGLVTAKALAYATGAALIGQDALAPQALMLQLACIDAEFAAKHNALTELHASAINEQNLPDAPVHVTLAVNDARRKQLYFALYGDADADADAAQTQHALMSESRPLAAPVTLMDMDIDYPDAIVQRVNERVKALSEQLGTAVVVDIAGHGTGSYASAWEGMNALGTVVDHSVFDLGADGLELVARCAQHDRGQNNDNDDAQAVEPLYLRRPDVSVPNPLKHVLHHDGATRGEQ